MTLRIQNLSEMSYRRLSSDKYDWHWIPIAHCDTASIKTVLDEKPDIEMQRSLMQLQKFHLVQRLAVKKQ